MLTSFILVQAVVIGILIEVSIFFPEMVPFL